MGKENSTILLRLSKELKAEIEAEAKEQNRSFNSQVIQILTNRDKAKQEVNKPFNFKERVDKYLEFLKDDSNKGKEFKP